MQCYRFEHEVTWSPEAIGWQETLQHAYRARLRPVCLCQAEGDDRATLYISNVNGTLVLKRMPNTGRLHAPACEHFEAPPELSGAGQVMGSAIRVDPERETTALALDFPLTKGGSRLPPGKQAIEHESVRSDGTRLTLRATLHYLYDEAGLSRWTPHMAGRRSWGVVRRELLGAAANKTTKGLPLPLVLFVPEPFWLEQASDILVRREASLSRLNECPGSRMLFIAPVKRLEPARYGHRLVLKHLADMPLHVNDAVHRRLTSVFEQQLALWDQLPTSQLLAVGTLSRTAHGVVELESASLVNVNAGWLPFESMQEYQLLEALAGRRFSKGLRYNLPAATPLASVVLHDTPVPTALYLLPAGAPADFLARLRALAEGSGMDNWWWHCGQGAMPALPLVASMASVVDAATRSDRLREPPPEGLSALSSGDPVA